MSEVACSMCETVVSTQKGLRWGVFNSATGNEISTVDAWKAFNERNGGAPFFKKDFAHAIQDGMFPDWEWREWEEEISITGPTPFEGTDAEALEAGWVEGTYGWACPNCVLKVDDSPSVGTGDEVLAMLKGAVVKED